MQAGEAVQSPMDLSTTTTAVENNIFAVKSVPLTVNISPVILVPRQTNMDMGKLYYDYVCQNSEVFIQIYTVYDQ